jgi:release factor glutamine methyltransferase
LMSTRDEPMHPHGAEAAMDPILRHAIHLLRDGGVESAFLDSVLLMCLAVGETKERVLAGLPNTIDETGLQRFTRLVNARLSGVPIAYLRRSRDFYGVAVRVDPWLLIPRPDTECLVERTRHRIREFLGQQARTLPLRVHDCCTGTGAVPIALADALSPEDRSRVDIGGSDLVSASVAVARTNADATAGAEKVSFQQSDLLSAVSGTFDLVTANPPYIDVEELQHLAPEVRSEPSVALVADQRGVHVLRRLASDSLRRIRPGGALLLECAPSQAAEISGIMSDLGYGDVQVYEDAAGRPRVVEGRQAWHRSR